MTHIDTQLRSGALDDILARLIMLQPESREDMKTQVREVLKDYQEDILDTHNTTSMIAKFTVDNTRYGLKIEYGEAEVTKSEARWYELAPDDLKTHHIASHIADDYAFVLLRWLHNARTIEEIAIANEGKNTTETIDLVIKALDQDKELFESNSTIPLLHTSERSYFLDKYKAYNAKAENYPYLQELLHQKHIVVNGKTLAGPHALVDFAQNDDQLRTYLSPDKAGLIHGDSHCDNLLVEDGKVYLIDPKGVDHLPLEYDTGRVIWSLTGWNAIVRGEYTLAEENGGYTLEYTRRQQYVDGMPRIREYFTDQEYHRAVYSAAIQYLTRVSHAAVESETVALYLRGLELFDELLDELGTRVKYG